MRRHAVSICIQSCVHTTKLAPVAVIMSIHDGRGSRSHMTTKTMAPEISLERPKQNHNELIAESDDWDLVAQCAFGVASTTKPSSG